MRSIGVALLAMAVVFAAPAAAQSLAFTTEAGVSSIGSADGTGSAARFMFPGGVAVDAAGNLYVGDSGNNTIRQITPAGVVTTLAGSPQQFGNVNATGSAARFGGPNAVTVDAAGNLYVTDSQNHAIRKITPGGVVTTFAGSATGASGSADGTGNAARFSRPGGITIDGAGNLYVVDNNNQKIRKITPAAVVTTLAGAGTIGSTDGAGAVAQFNFSGGITGIAVDTGGNLFVTDTGNNTIRQITPLGAVTTLAGTAGTNGGVDATGSAARFRAPRGLAIDTAGVLYVAEGINHTIRKIAPGAVVTTLAGLFRSAGSADGAGTTARFNNPTGLAVTSTGTLYVGDMSSSTIRAITSSGVVSTLAGLPGSAGNIDGVGSAARLLAPRGMAVDAAGTQYVADSGNHTIRKITAGGVVSTFAGQASIPGSADGTGLAAQFTTPGAVALDSAGNLYVADTGNSTIRKITAAGVVSTLAGLAGSFAGIDGTGSAARFNSPSGVAVDAAGTIYVADTNNSTIRAITPAGVVTTLAGGTFGVVSGFVDGTAGAARFNQPRGLTVDANGIVYVADANNNAIRRVTPAGVVTTLAGPPAAPSSFGLVGFQDGVGSAARFNGPQGIAVDRLFNLYVADTNNHAIRLIKPGGVVSTVAGQGFPGSRDGRFRALFNSPTGIAVDGARVVYVGDTLNNTTRLGLGANPSIASDFDRDAAADLTIFRPSDGNWFIRNSTTGYVSNTIRQFGLTGDIPVSGDYDGDGQGDVAVWRPASGVWYILTSSSNYVTTLTYTLGVSTDIPVPGDYDEDGRTDLAVYRPGTGTWIVLASSDNYTAGGTVGFGLSTDIPVPGDYDGDGSLDLAVFRPSTGTWFLQRTSTPFLAVQWGLAGDVPVPGDYDGDGKTDLAVWRPSTGTWYIKLSTTNFTTSMEFQWGVNGDIPVPSDYDGDGKIDLAVHRPATGTWHVRQSTGGYSTEVSFQWGGLGDTPTPNVGIATAMARASGKPTLSTLANRVRESDMDGDGKSDLTVWRPSTGTFFTLQSSGNSTPTGFQLGSAGDIPGSGDFDGDGKTDIGVFTPSTGTWSALLAQFTFTPNPQVQSVQWGASGDIPVPGDYDGDGRSSLAVWRPSDGVWYILQSVNPRASVSYQWGQNGDVPVPGDYDGDGLTDLAVWRPSPSNGVWYILTSSTNYTASVSYQWGVSGDVPVPGDYDGDGKTDLAIYRPSTGTWFIKMSTTGYATSVSFQWGLSSDTPVPGDFDGDGKTDVAVYRPSNGTWFVLPSSNPANPSVFQWGTSGDIPILRRP